MNKFISDGRATRDPELTYTPSQLPICKCGFATGGKWKDKNGSERDDTCFVDLVSFGKTAELFNRLVSKGVQVLVEGRLAFESWEAKDGTKRSKHNVVIESFRVFNSPAKAPVEDNATPPSSDQSGMPEGDIPF